MSVKAVVMSGCDMMTAFSCCIPSKMCYDYVRNMHWKGVLFIMSNQMIPTNIDMSRQNDDGIHVESSTARSEFVDMMDENGMMHHSSTLGDFVYDPAEFEVQRVEVPKQVDNHGLTEDMKHDGYMYVLRYIGTETDGSKIHVPEGLKDMSLTFNGTDIKSTPKIPSSVEFMYGSFASCHQLETADMLIPPSVKSSEFAFADCVNLKKGPSVIPGTIDNANYMFANCSSLENTPKIGKGVKQGERMFMGCEKLTKEPNVPSSMTEYKDMTRGCTGIDAAKDAQAQAKLARDREKYAKKLTRKGMLAQIGSGFGFAMQVHAMRQSGYNMLIAPLMVHSMRKNGQLATNFTGGIAANMMTKGGMSGVLGMKLAQTSANNEIKRQQQNRARMTDWDNAHSVGQGTRKDLQSQTRAKKDLKRGLFARMGMEAGAEEKSMYRALYNQQYAQREQIMCTMDGKGLLDSRTKHNMSQWYQQQMSSCATYYAEGVRSIKDSDMNPVEKQRAMKGLKEVSRLQMEPLMQSAEHMQTTYQIFNDGDMRNIKNLLADLPSEKEKPKSFVERMTADKANVSREMHESIQESMNRRAFRQFTNANTSGRRTPHFDTGQSSTDDEYEL